MIVPALLFRLLLCEPVDDALLSKFALPELLCVTLGSPETDVLTHFGPPRAVVTDIDFPDPWDPISPGLARTMSFPGLTIQVWDVCDVLTPLCVSDIEVASSCWRFSNGLQVGMSRRAVRQLLGPPPLTAVDGQPDLSDSWTYLVRSDRVELRLYFAHDVVTSIVLTQLLSC